MTWMYQGKTELFPYTKSSAEEELKEVYPIKGRKYDIRNIAEGDGVVMVELIERYPDSKTGETYRTPLVLVLEMKDGKIRKGRHYCDPHVSHLHLSDERIEEGFRGTESKMIISGD